MSKLLHAILRPVCLLIAVVAATAARADLINLTGAETAPNILELTVRDDAVSVALEIFPADLAYFADIVPDEAFGKNLPDRPDESARLLRFAEKSLRIETFSGEVLSVRVERVEPRMRINRKSLYAGMVNPQTGRLIPGAPEDKRVIYAELIYPFEEKPDGIIITPPLDKSGKAVASIGFIAYHKSIPVIDFRYLSKSSWLDLDWQDPWYTAFHNPNLKRHHRDAIMGFLYMEPRRIRQEALIRVRDLEQWIDLGLDGLETIPEGIQEALLHDAATFFASANKISSDGETLEPIATRASFVEIGTSGITVVDEPRDIERNTALVGIVTTYEIDQLPQKVDLDWQLFVERQDRVPVTLYDPAGPFLSTATSADRKVTWKNFLTQYREPAAEPVLADAFLVYSAPLGSAGLVLLAMVIGVSALRTPHRRGYLLAGIVACLVGAVVAYPLMRFEVANPFAADPDNAELAQITQDLVENLYVGLDEHDPNLRESAFDTSSAAGQASQIEAEAERGLIVGLAGGSRARSYEVSDMALRNVSPLDRTGAVSAVATWKTKVSGGHWGHVHLREVTYEALVELVPQSGLWKLAGLTITSGN